MKHVTATEPLLDAKGVTKRFGATLALSDFNFDLFPGKIHALVGENGAGKSTFIKILAGMYSLDQGELNYADTPDGKATISFIHQDLGIISDMTAGENVLVGADYPRRFGIIDWKRLHREAAETLSIVSNDIDPRAPVSSLSMADRALVAIARALYQNANILVLDEPTATLPGTDVKKLFTVLNQLRDRGIGMIYVSHRLREILEIADEVTVVRDGKKCFNGTSEGLSEATIISHMVGSDHISHPVREETLAIDKTTTPRLSASLSVKGSPEAKIEVWPGEIVGCVGLRGAGQEILGQAVAGVTKTDGSMSLDGSSYQPKNVDAALSQGVSFITGDRTVSIAANMSVQENLFIHPRHSAQPGELRSPRGERKATEKAIDDYDVRPRFPNKNIGLLSGGNIQKIVFARGLGCEPRLVVLEDPTAGVDMPTRNALYDLMREKAAEGVGFLVTSSDHDEVAAVCDRILVFRNGSIVHELDQAPFDADEIVDLFQEGS